jgi:glycosyltransferase involved in cell wall biosynthesis
LIGSSINVLALSPIPEEGAGCRFRVSQYVPYLGSHGIEVRVSSFYTPEFFRLVYRHGHYLTKSSAFLRLLARRWSVLNEVDRYDAVLLYREAIPIGPPFIERQIARRGIPIVYDFDDAIFLPNVSEANRAISFLKSTSRPKEIIRFSRHVMVGNEFLAQYARQFNPNVTVVPTAVDTSRFAPRPPASRAPGPLVVGWIGSPTTFHYLDSIAPLLQDVATRHSFVLRVSGAGKPIRFPGVSVHEEKWSLDREVTLFNTCDVGVYPLDDDDWARGKCGFKAIQFMACGVPTVAAAVGVNREIIRDGENGFLASTPAEWVAKLERLLSDAALRARFARAGRETIEERYSSRVTAPVVARIIRSAAEEGRQAAEERSKKNEERKGR